MKRSSSELGLKFFCQNTESSNSYEMFKWQGRSSEKQAVFTVGWRRLQPPCALVHLSILSYHLTPVAKIGDKIVETLSLNGVTFENKTSAPIPPSLHLKLGCLLFPSCNSSTTLHGRRVGGKSFILLFWSWQNVRKVEIVSANFLSDVANSQMHQYIPFVNLNL